MTVTYDAFIGSYGTEAEETIHWLKFNSEKEDFEVVSAVTGFAGTRSANMLILSKLLRPVSPGAIDCLSMHSGDVVAVRPASDSAPYVMVKLL